MSLVNEIREVRILAMLLQDFEQVVSAALANRMISADDCTSNQPVECFSSGA